MRYQKGVKVKSERASVDRWIITVTTHLVLGRLKYVLLETYYLTLTENVRKSEKRVVRFFFFSPKTLFFFLKFWKFWQTIDFFVDKFGCSLRKTNNT